MAWTDQSNFRAIRDDDHALIERIILLFEGGFFKVELSMDRSWSYFIDQASGRTDGYINGRWGPFYKLHSRGNIVEF